MPRKHLEIIWKHELWFGTHSSTPRTICPQWWTDSWVSLNFSFELNGSKQVLKITNITQMDCSWLVLHIGTHPLKHIHARHNAGNRTILVQLLFYKEKKGQILSEEVLLFWRLFYKDEDQKQKNLQNSSSSDFTNSFFKAFLTYLQFIYFAFREPVPLNPSGKELSHDLEWWTYLK